MDGLKVRTISNEVDRILSELEKMEVDSPEYEVKVKQLEVLCRSKSYKADRLLNMDVLVPAAVNLIGILLILNHERLNVISSKAVGFIFKPRM